MILLSEKKKAKTVERSSMATGAKTRRVDSEKDDYECGIEVGKRTERNDRDTQMMIELRLERKR